MGGAQIGQAEAASGHVDPILRMTYAELLATHGTSELNLTRLPDAAIVPSLILQAGARPLAPLFDPAPPCTFPTPPLPASLPPCPLARNRSSPSGATAF